LANNQPNRGIGIIIANKMDLKLKYATHNAPHIILVEYGIGLIFKKVKNLI
jgi:hypothetical protein